MLSDVLGSVDFGKSTYSSPKWSLACEQRVGRPNPYGLTAYPLPQPPQSIVGRDSHLDKINNPDTSGEYPRMLSDVLGSVDFGKSTYSSPKWSLACEQRVGRPNPYGLTAYPLLSHRSRL